MSKDKPEIRFAGYTDAWEERKLGDVVGEIQSGNRLPKDSLIDGDIPYVVAQTKNKGVYKKISKETLDYNGNPMKLFPGNSISFSIDNPEAMFYRSGDFYTSNIMRVIHADYLSHQQYLFILENMKNFIKGYDWSRKFSGPVVSNLEYLQPTEQEQIKIGSLILTFDKTIDLHQRQLDLLKEQKKGFLQKMFPKQGAKVPELRFAGFTDDWEKRRLGDVVNKVKSYSLSRDVERNESTGYKYIHYGDIHTGIADIIKKESVLPNIKPNQYDTLSVNDIIVADASEDYQGIASPAVIQALPDENLVAGLHTIALRPQATNATFLYYLLHTGNFKHFGYRTGTGLKVFGISWPNLSKFEFNLPSQKEQDKVVDLLRLLDNLVVVNQRRVDLLKQEKKALLQKMFV